MVNKRKGCKPSGCSTVSKIHKPTKNILKMIEKNKQGIKLDVGCGSNKQKGFIGMDIRAIEGVDIVHDVEDTPYPLPKECFQTILASHLVEHLNPKLMIKIMDEWWRLLRPSGQLWIAIPYATSFGFYQDPTHCNPWNEATPTYFSPYHPFTKYTDPSPGQ